MCYRNVIMLSHAHELRDNRPIGEDFYTIAPREFHFLFKHIRLNKLLIMLFETDLPFIFSFKLLSRKSLAKRTGRILNAFKIYHFVPYSVTYAAF